MTAVNSILFSDNFMSPKMLTNSRGKMSHSTLAVTQPVQIDTTVTSILWLQINTPWGNEWNI